MDIKKEAKRLRRKGLSYNVISKELNVPKGTLSYWFKGDKGLNKITARNIKLANVKAAVNITKYNKKRSVLARQRWEILSKKAQSEIKSISGKELFLIGIALYWAEGYKRGKWNVIFTNSDLCMNILMLKFFIECCGVSKDKIRLHLQVHHKKQVATAISFWSKKLKMPDKYFLKTTIQGNIVKSSKINRLPYGTLRIKINDVVLVNKIKGWINGLILNSGCGSVG